MADLPEEHVTALEQRLAAHPTSPLFTRLAGYYLQMGRAEDALRVCDDGLAHHPSYSTAHLIKAKALLALHMPSEAKREFGIVSDFLPSNKTVSDLYSSIEVPEAPAATEETEPVAEVASGDQLFTGVAEESPQVVEEEPQAGFAPVEEETQDGFAPAEEQQPSPFGGEEVQSAEPEAAEGFGETAAQEPAPVEALPQPVIPTYDEADPLAALRSDSGEDAFGETPAVASKPEATEPDAPSTDYFDAFSQLQQVSQENETASPDTEATDENPFAAFGAGADDEGQAAPSVTGEGESFEEFSARTRMELFGTENTMTLDEYLGGTPDTPAPPAMDQIGELAEKLKTPKKITPVINFSEKETRKASEAGTDAGSGFVTPTLAEIYAKQGWYDDAIKAYKTLAANKPAERESYERRIAELEELKNKQ